MVLCGLIVILLMPVTLVVASWVIIPIDRIARLAIVLRARRRLRTWHGTHVIGIAGSYGKTSQKEILATILGARYRILTPSGTLNTPLGISRTVLGATSAPEIFIVEMGEHYRGDIRELADLVRPTIGIVTGITEQHLERMGSIDTIIDTIFELAEGLPPGGVCYVDSRHPYVQRGLQKYGSLPVEYRDSGAFSIENLEYLPDFAGMRWMYRGHTVEVPLLGEHVVTPIMTAWEIARSLGMEDRDIVRAITLLRPVPHRLELIRNTERNLFIIDDGFNGNLEGVRATVRLFDQVPFAGRRLYLTPGLVELGDEADRIHRTIGRAVATVFDLILLIDTTATRSIRMGLAEAGYPESQIVVYPDTETAHRDIGAVLRTGDAIVFQNDWTDNYR